MNQSLAILLVAIAVGCASTPENSQHKVLRPDPTVYHRWTEQGNYYALLEIVDAHIHEGVTKADVLKHLGTPFADNPEDYPNAGPNNWVYHGNRRAPYGSYLYIGFDQNGLIKELSWGSE